MQGVTMAWHGRGVGRRSHRIQTLVFDRWVGLASKKTEPSAWEPPEGEPTGALAHVALKILTKILYVAHMARPDILRATCMLPRK